VLHGTFTCKVFLDHPQNICFFVGDVAVHLQLGLAINKKRTKRKLGFSKTLDYIDFFEDGQNQEMQNKNQEKS
jgi:hypothetical protein